MKFINEDAFHTHRPTKYTYRLNLRVEKICSTFIAWFFIFYTDRFELASGVKNFSDNTIFANYEFDHSENLLGAFLTSGDEAPEQSI